jgi:L-asparaginase II
MPDPILVELTRGDLVESVHRAAVAVCDAEGRVIAEWGNVERPVYPRSAIKMLQALPLVETGAVEAFVLSDEHLALACASHSGEAMHTGRVGAWLGRIGATDNDLRCGPHFPYGEPARDAMIRSGETPLHIHNNCSGKHTGFLTVARQLGAPLEAYVDTIHPVQLAVMDAIAGVAGVSVGAWDIGIDGCSAPNYALPLSRWAYAMARLATGQGLPSARARAAQRLVSAMRDHPELMSGTGRACAHFIRATEGRAIVKTGAEGVFVAILPGRGLGVALKVEDGATRASETLMAACLIKLGVLDPQHPTARLYVDAPIRNWEGVAVGVRRPVAGFLAQTV